MWVQLRPSKETAVAMQLLMHGYSPQATLKTTPQFTTHHINDIYSVLGNLKNMHESSIIILLYQKPCVIIQFSRCPN